MEAANIAKNPNTPRILGQRQSQVVALLLKESDKQDMNSWYTGPVNEWDCNENDSPTIDKHINSSAKLLIMS